MRDLLPPRPFLDSLMIRTILVWVFLRLASMVGTSMDAGIQSSGLAGPVALALLLDPLVVLVLFIDMTRRSELLFLANLGRSFRGMAAVVVTMCLLLETALRVAVG